MHPLLVPAEAPGARARGDCSSASATSTSCSHMAAGDDGAADGDVYGFPLSLSPQERTDVLACESYAARRATKWARWEAAGKLPSPSRRLKRMLRKVGNCANGLAGLAG